MPFECKVLRDAARDQRCVCCGIQDGTVVLAHLAWPGIADKSMSAKCHDFWGAWLCARCHYEADNGAFLKDLEWRTQMVARTLLQLFLQGVVKV